MSRSSDVDAVFVSPALHEAAEVYGDPAALTAEVYGDVAADRRVRPPRQPEPPPEPPREPPPDPAAGPRRTKATRRRQGALLRRSEHLASRLAREPRGGAHPASSYDRQELDALRWVLDEVLPSWFRSPG